MIFSKENIQILSKSTWDCQQLMLLFQFQKNVDVPILENIHSLVSENVDVPILRNIYSPVPENANIPIPENNHISQTQFQKVDLDILWNNDFWVFFLVDNLLILYGCIFEKKNFVYLRPPQFEILHPSLRAIMNYIYNTRAIS